MLESFKETIQVTILGPIAFKFNIDEAKTDGIVETITNIVKEKSGDLSGVSESGIGASIMSSLTTKNGLKKNEASRIKDMVMPLIMDFKKNKLMNKIPGGARDTMNKSGGLV
jgi:hypothetical protein